MNRATRRRHFKPAHLREVGVKITTYDDPNDNAYELKQMTCSECGVVETVRELKA